MTAIVKILENQQGSASLPEYRIIDVREPEEVKTTGKISDALNIPGKEEKPRVTCSNIVTSIICTIFHFTQIIVAEVPKALRTSPADFVKLYGFEKFKDSQTLVFYCQSGKRSQVAADYALQNGFK